MRRQRGRRGDGFGLAADLAAVLAAFAVDIVQPAVALERGVLFLAEIGKGAEVFAIKSEGVMSSFNGFIVSADYVG